jgi:peroxiredoxin
MVKRIKRSISLLSLILFIFLIILPLYIAEAPKQQDLIIVSLKRNENYSFGIFYLIEFNQEKVAAVLKNRPLKLPPSLSSKAQIGITIDKIYAALEKLPEQKSVRLIIDCNRNDDLTDDKPIEIKESESKIIKILRYYTVPKEKEVWLPYKVRYSIERKKNGIQEHYILLMANYCMEGYLKINGYEYFMTLTDMYTDGKFDQKDFIKSSCIGIDLNRDGQIKGREEYYFGWELIPIGKKFYEIREVMEDGSIIVFAQSNLQLAMVGKEAPDFLLTDINGKRFRIQEKRGKIVLLVFWASWCEPCVKKLFNIKKLFEQYENSSLIIIGINIDYESRVNKALEIIKKYKLPWIHVIQGKGDYSPIWRVYGSISGNVGIPLYILIDSFGIIKYGGKDIEKIKSILDELI